MRMLGLEIDRDSITLHRKNKQYQINFYRWGVSGSIYNLKTGICTVIFGW